MARIPGMCGLRQWRKNTFANKDTEYLPLKIVLIIILHTLCNIKNIYVVCFPIILNVNSSRTECSNRVLGLEGRVGLAAIFVIYYEKGGST